MYEKIVTWLFTPEERQPVSFVTTFFLIIILSTAISVFVVSIDNYFNDRIEYLWEE